MLKVRLHHFIALLLLLAFTSQTVAMAAMNCGQQKAATEITMDMSAMDHSDPDMAYMHHAMNATDNVQHKTFDCCKSMGHCLFGGCTFATTSNGIVFLFNKSDSAVEDFYFGTTPTPLISSLYRPPIFS